MSGRKPGEQVSKDGISTGVGGFKWNPLEDSVQIKFQICSLPRKLEEGCPMIQFFFILAFMTMENLSLRN